MFQYLINIISLNSLELYYRNFATNNFKSITLTTNDDFFVVNNLKAHSINYTMSFSIIYN